MAYGVTRAGGETANLFRQGWSLFQGGSLSAEELAHYDWGALLPYLEQNRLSGHVYSRHARALPEKVRLSLRREWQEQWARNAYYLRERTAVQKGADAIGLEPVFLKGIALLGEVYPDSGARFLCDMDLLVEPAALDAARALLGELGYTAAEPHRWAANENRSVFTRVRDGITLAVELHDSLFFREPAAWRWRTQIAASGNFRRLDATDMLLHLSGHYGAQHTFLLLHWLIDIERLLRCEGAVIDWELAFQRAEALGIARNLRLVLLCLERKLGMALPEAASLHLARHPLTRAAHRLLFSDRFLWDAAGARAHYYLVKHFTRDRVRDTLAYDVAWIRGRGWE